MSALTTVAWAPEAGCSSAAVLNSLCLYWVKAYHYVSSVYVPIVVFMG
jgi:hypothetical protein